MSKASQRKQSAFNLGKLDAKSGYKPRKATPLKAIYMAGYWAGKYQRG
ncbi:MAG: hypothetical protein ACK5LJ_17635 [Paracoccus sp. (in: a-proteobacteria)]